MKRLLALFLCLCITGPSWAACAFDKAAETSNTGTSTSIPITVAAGSNRVLVVAVSYDLAARHVTTITGAGATWASSAFGTFSDATNLTKQEIWYGTNPTTGAQTVVVNNDLSGIAGVLVWSFNGVDQTTPLAGYAAAHSAANPFTASLATASGDCGAASFMSGGHPLGSAAGACNGANDGTDQAPSGFFSGGGHCLASGSLTIGFTNPGADIGMQQVIVQQVQAAGGVACPAIIGSGIICGQ